MASTNILERKTGNRPAKAPVLTVTRYDRVSSVMMATVVGLILGVVWLGILWASNRRPKLEELAELELFEIPGGVLDGAIDETLRVDSPEDVTNDPAVTDTPEEENEITEVLENVVELSEFASQQVQEQFEIEAQNTGKAGSATGTGRRALGDGPGESGLPRAQRWFVRFSNRVSLAEYARQLDFFGIELGALVPGPKLVYLAQASQPRPKVRSVETGDQEKRLYMNWQGGGRRKADVEIFQKSGIDVGAGAIFHFYPRQTERMLARLERDYRNRPVDQIRRTYFVVRRNRSAYEFVVTRQSYLN